MGRHSLSEDFDVALLFEHIYLSLLFQQSFNLQKIHLMLTRPVSQVFALSAVFNTARDGSPRQLIRPFLAEVALRPKAQVAQHSLVEQEP